MPTMSNGDAFLNGRTGDWRLSRTASCESKRQREKTENAPLCSNSAFPFVTKPACLSQSHETQNPLTTAGKKKSYRLS
jgi:hypothetical protein